jgi:CRISPR-associated protein Cas1
VGFAMQLYLDSYGAYLSVRNGCFAVRTKAGGERAFALRQVDAILLTRGTALSADAALLAAENDIPVLLIDARTHFPLAQVWHGRPTSLAAIRRNQAVFSRAPEGYAWVARQLAAKIVRQRAHLRRLAEMPGAPDGFAAGVALTDRVMASLGDQLAGWTAPATWDAAAIDAAGARVRGPEGTASRLYFQKLAEYLAGRVDFPGRAQRPAYDPFNALLNYLYGMLYTHVHLALLKSGLDPYLGVLHADQYGGRPTLVYDAIEPYRPWADAVAAELFTAGRLGEADFEPAPESAAGLWLAASGKDRAIDALLAWLAAPSDDFTLAGGKRARRSVQIDLEAQRLAVELKEVP